MLKSSSKLLAAFITAVLAFAISPVLPASSSALPSYESRLSVVFSKSETGSGQSRTITYTAVVTDTLGLLVGPGTTPSGQQVQVSGMNVDLCQSEPLPRVAGWTFPAGCQTITNAPTTHTGSGANITISESYTGQNLVTFEANLLSFPVEVPLVGFDNAAGEKMLIMSSSRSASAGSGATSTPDNDPGVSFAGFLISGASGRVVDAETAGTLRFTGKRLNQVASATIGGIAVTVTSATRSALELDFDSLPEGKHDVVLTSKSGAKTTLRGFVTVN